MACTRGHRVLAAVERLPVCPHMKNAECDVAVSNRASRYPWATPGAMLPDRTSLLVDVTSRVHMLAASMSLSSSSHSACQSDRRCDHATPVAVCFAWCNGGSNNYRATNKTAV